MSIFVGHMGLQNMSYQVDTPCIVNGGHWSFWVLLTSSAWELGFSKGQIISECLFGVFNFFQKTNENKSHSSKGEFIRCFLEEFAAWQFVFEINWPLQSSIYHLRLQIFAFGINFFFWLDLFFPCFFLSFHCTLQHLKLYQ